MRLKKYYLVSLVVIVAGVIALLFYNQPVNKESKKVDTVQDVKEDKSPAKEVSTKPADKEAITKPANKEVSTKPANKEEEKELTELREKYQPKFTEMNSSADKRLSILIEQAEKEFKVKKERKIDLDQVTHKYIGIQNGYEENTNTQFDSLIAEIQKEDLDNKYITILVEEFSNLYQEKKEERKGRLSKELKKLL